MNKSGRNIFRDSFVLSLPLLGMLIYNLATVATSLINGEVNGFHGHTLRNTRVGGLSHYLLHNERALLPSQQPAYLSTRLMARSTVPILDLRIEGHELDKLQEQIPASGKKWREGILVHEGRAIDVEVRYRGNTYGNYFFASKAWKIKTAKNDLVAGVRDISLTPASTTSHIGFVVCRQLEVPTPQSRYVRLFINKRDQGLYLQEQPVSESMIRQNRRMPGDVFYGELDVQDDFSSDLSCDGLFWNPYLWDKKSRYNRYSEEYRDHLCELIDAVHDPSFERLYGIIDVPEFSRFMAAMVYHGDGHIDESHNHRLYFNPLSGKFDAIAWDMDRFLSADESAESMANPLFRKLCRDPR